MDSSLNTFNMVSGWWIFINLYGDSN